MRGLTLRVDARIKLITYLAFVLLILSLKSLISLGTSLGGISLLLAIYGRKEGIGSFAARIRGALPFLVAAILVVAVASPRQPSASKLDTLRAAAVMLRMLTILCATMLLQITTPLPALLDGLAGLGVPHMFVELLGFSVRYISVLSDEAQRLKRARDSRCFSPRSIFHPRTIHATGAIIGALLIRSYDRAQRVYRAMLSRNYTGVIRSKPQGALGTPDLCWGALAIAYIVLTVVMDRVFLR